MKILFTLASIFTVFFSTAQKADYRKMKDTICPPACGWRDSLSLTEIKSKMLDLDTNRLMTKSRSKYYEDLANVEYQLFAYTTDSICLRNSASYNVSALYHDAKNYSACWNAAYAFGMINDCENMKHYLALYKEKIPRRYFDEDSKKQVKYLEDKCD